MGRATPLGPWESSDWPSRGRPKKLFGAKNSHAGMKSDVILRCRSAKVAVRPAFSQRLPISADNRVVRYWATPCAPRRERRGALHPERLVVGDCRLPLDLTIPVVVQRIIVKPALISSRFHSRQSHLAGPICERPVKVLRCSLKGAREGFDEIPQELEQILGSSGSCWQPTSADVVVVRGALQWKRGLDGRGGRLGPDETIDYIRTRVAGRDHSGPETFWSR